MCPGWHFALPHFHSVLWALQQDKCAGSWCLCVNSLPKPKDTGTNFENKVHCVPSRGLIPYLFPSCSLAWFCMLICYILFLPNKSHFWRRMCTCAWVLTSTKLLNIPSCKHTFNWLLFESVFLFICTYGRTYNPADLMILRVLEWLVCFWLWGLCGVQPDHTSFCQSLQADSCLRFVLKHIRSNHKLCFWLCQSSYQGGANSSVCWFFIKNSPSVCHHSSPVGIREVIPKCLSPKNHREYQAPVSTERVMTQSSERGLGAHAEPADRAVTCPWGQTTPISLSAGPLRTVAADRQPGNHCLTGKAEREAKTSTKTKVWLTENTLQAGTGSYCKERKQRRWQIRQKGTKWWSSLLRITQQGWWQKSNWAFLVPGLVLVQLSCLASSMLWLQSPQPLRPVIICTSAEAGFWISPMLVYPPGKSDGNAAAYNDLIPLPMHWNHKRLPSLNIAKRDLWLISISPISAVGGTALNRNYTKWI